MANAESFALEPLVNVCLTEKEVQDVRLGLQLLIGQTEKDLRHLAYDASDPGQPGKHSISEYGVIIDRWRELRAFDQTLRNETGVELSLSEGVT